MNYIVIIVSILVIVGFITGYLIYFKSKLAKNNAELSELSDKIMKQYLDEGKDIFYKEMNDEDLLSTYKKSLNTENSKDASELARVGVEGKIMEDELASRGHDVTAIINKELNL